jgi:hypothetical protein
MDSVSSNMFPYAHKIASVLLQEAHFNNRFLKYKS